MNSLKQGRLFPYLPQAGSALHRTRKHTSTEAAGRHDFGRDVTSQRLGSRHCAG